MLLLSAIALALAGRPVVEQLDPPADAVDVDPDRTAISVRFDQPMSQDSWSWTGAPPLFPKATDKPRFDDRRTATMPVALEPGTLYMLGVNSAQHTGFRSKANEPAVPVLWRFVTAGEALPQEVHDASLEQAEAALTLRYSHQGRKSVDWSEALAFMREGALSRPAFALALAHALGAAEDMHLTVVVDGVRLGTHEQTIEPNVDGRLLDARLSERLDGATYAGVNDGIGTLVITSWTVEQRDVSAVDRWLDAHCDQPLIVDVRLNSGGDEVLARQIAGRFTEERVVYAKQRVRRSDGSFGEVGSRWLEPRGTRCTGPVVVLTGPACASAATTPQNHAGFLSRHARPSTPSRRCVSRLFDDAMRRPPSLRLLIQSFE